MTSDLLEKEAKDYALKQWEGNIPWGVIQKAYYDSAEPREKRIEELIALIDAERKRQEECDDVHLRKIVELEKENAELKEQLRLAKEMPYSAVKKFAEEKTQEQLTKAKELLKRCYDNYIYLEPLRSEIEQFLNEVEK